MKLHQENDKIIVTELRPMSSLPDDEFVLIKPKSQNALVHGRVVTASSKHNFSGWLPIPIYDPSHKPVDDFSRGVRTMFDYLQTRIANNFSGNHETQAHLNEINKTMEEWLSDAMQEVSESDYQEWLTVTQAYAAGVERYKRCHERYEKLRKLNVQQFSALYERNILGENFDEMVDEL